MFEEALTNNNLKYENKLTEKIYSSVQKCMDIRLQGSERTGAWENALSTVVKKYSVGLRIGQGLRPAEYREPLIDKSLIDDRILEGFSPGLKVLVDRGEVNTQAAFAIVEYFLKTGRHNLSEKQVVSLVQKFSSCPDNLSFKDYKLQREQDINNYCLPGKSQSETWGIRREAMDILEIANLIKARHLSYAFGKTIYVSDLVKAAVDGLNTIHMADTRLGVKKIMLRDRELLKSPEATMYREPKGDVLSRLLKRPDIFFSMLFSGKARDFGKDTERVFKQPQNIEIEGLEKIPQTGPLIVAFSHIERWKDLNIAPGWEKMKMIEGLQKARQKRNIYLLAYLSYYNETAPRIFKGKPINKFMEIMQKGAEISYGLHLVDVNPYDREKMKTFLNQTQAILNDGNTLLISPEGIPVTETVKPKRGLGTISRISGAPVLGVAFREERLSDGSFQHKVIFTPVRIFNSHELSGKSYKEKDQEFAESIMKDIARCLPEDQRGIYR